MVAAGKAAVGQITQRADVLAERVVSAVAVCLFVCVIGGSTAGVV